MNELVLVEESPSAGTRHQVAVGDTIGREGCEIVLADPEVSRRHAKLRSLDSALALEDLGSTNGTYVNGQRLEGVCELKDGDAIKMGNSALRVEAQVQDGATRLTPSHPAPPAVESTPRVATPVPSARVEPAPPEPPGAVEPPTAPVEAAPTAPLEPAAPPAAAAAAPPASPAPSAPSRSRQPTEFGQIRGDVPAPGPASASRVHQTLDLTPSPPRHEFDAGGTGGTRRGSAATRVEATVVAYAVVIATAVAVILYILAEKV